MYKRPGPLRGEPWEPNRELFREPLHVPLGSALDVRDNHLKSAKVEGGDRIEAHVEKDEGPFKKRVDGVGWCHVSASFWGAGNMTYLRRPGRPCAG